MEALIFFVLTLASVAACAAGYFISTLYAKTHVQKLQKELKEKGDALDKEVRRRCAAEQQLTERFSNSKESKLFIQNQRKVVDGIIADLKADRDKILAEKLRYEALLASISDGVVAVDNDGKVILMNKPAAELLGVKTTDVVGKDFTSFGTFENVNGVVVAPQERPLSITLKNGRAMSTSDYVVRHSQTKVIYLSMSTAPIVFKRKRAGAIAVFRDISKEKAADKAKTEFVSLASHQLRTPLSAISWNTEMLLNGDSGDLSTEQTEVVETINEGTHRMISLVNSLLNISRIELGTFTVDPEPVELKKLILDVVKEEMPLLTSKQLVLVKHLPSRFPTLSLDLKLTAIIIQNLLNNAAKYSPDNSTITITLAKHRSMARLVVADTGYGVPKAEQARVFEKLYRADNAKKLDSSGTGLGLYIVKSILDQVGGRIWFESVENKGCTFYVELPLSGMKQYRGIKKIDAIKS